MGKLPPVSSLKLIRLKKNIKIVGLATGVGAAVGFTQAMPGHRKEAAKQGAGTGALVAASYMIGKNKTAREAIKAGAKAAGKVLFRRIGGRVVPIKG